MKKHRGEIIEAAARDCGFTIKRLAKCLNISRNTLYSKFRTPELDTDFILALGEVIHYNFALDIPEVKRELEKRENGEGKGPETGEGISKYINQNAEDLKKLEKKYTVLLERYNELLAILAKTANANQLNILRKEITEFIGEHAPQAAV